MRVSKKQLEKVILNTRRTIQRKKVLIGNEIAFKLAVELKKVFPENMNPMKFEKNVIQPFYFKEQANLIDETKSPLSFEDFLDQFVESWGKVKYPNPLKTAKTLAEKSMNNIQALKHFGKERRYIAAVCIELQKIKGSGQPFYLSSYAFEDDTFIKIPQKTVYRFLYRLCFEGVLNHTKTGNLNEANYYHFVEFHKYLEP